MASRRVISLVVRCPYALPLATAHVHPCDVSTPQRRSTVTPTPPAAQPLKNRARDLREAQLLSRFIKRTDGDSSNRSNLLTPLQCGRTDGDSSSRAKQLSNLPQKEPEISPGGTVPLLVDRTSHFTPPSLHPAAGPRPPCAPSHLPIPWAAPRCCRGFGSPRLRWRHHPRASSVRSSGLTLRP